MRPRKKKSRERYRGGHKRHRPRSTDRVTRGREIGLSQTDIVRE